MEHHTRARGSLTTHHTRGNGATPPSAAGAASPHPDACPFTRKGDWDTVCPPAASSQAGTQTGASGRVCLREHSHKGPSREPPGSPTEPGTARPTGAETAGTPGGHAAQLGRFFPPAPAPSLPAEPAPAPPSLPALEPAPSPRFRACLLSPLPAPPLSLPAEPSASPRPPVPAPPSLHPGPRETPGCPSAAAGASGTVGVPRLALVGNEHVTMTSSRRPPLTDAHDGVGSVSRLLSTSAAPWARIGPPART